MKLNDVHKIRAFNRFYTGVIGLLDKYLLDSHFTLAEVRVMYEIHHHRKITSKEITTLLGMDKSYLSRMLVNFDKKGLIQRKATEADGRVQEISLTPKGEKEFLEVNHSTEKQITKLLSNLEHKEIQQLIVNMGSIQKILSKIGRDK